MTGFYYSSLSNYSQEAANQAVNFINLYADIPLDGVMLDEFGNPGIIPPWKIIFRFGNFRLRRLSEAMAKELENKTGEAAGITLFNMRCAPEGQP
jgi:hypothetical protein